MSRTRLMLATKDRQALEEVVDADIDESLML
jgi:hypothetical protein